MLADWETGQIKLHVIRALLHLRRELAGVFADGSYVPLEASGPRGTNVVAWCRRQGRHWVIAVIPRLTLECAGPGRFPTGTRVWGTTACLLPKRAPALVRRRLHGRTVAATRGRLDVANILGVLPVAVLREADS